MEHKQHQATRSSEEAGYELDDTNSIIPIIMSAGVFVMTLTAIFVTILLMGYFEASQPQVTTSSVQDTEQLPVGVRLQTDPARDWEEMEAADTYALEHYGWVDQDNNIVRVPIDVAIEMVVEEGLPSRSE